MWLLDSCAVSSFWKIVTRFEMCIHGRPSGKLAPAYADRFFFAFWDFAVAGGFLTAAFAAWASLRSRSKRNLTRRCRNSRSFTIPVYSVRSFTPACSVNVGLRDICPVWGFIRHPQNRTKLARIGHCCAYASANLGVSDLANVSFSWRVARSTVRLLCLRPLEWPGLEKKPQGESILNSKEKNSSRRAALIIL